MVAFGITVESHNLVDVTHLCLFFLLLSFKHLKNPANQRISALVKFFRELGPQTFGSHIEHPSIYFDSWELAFGLDRYS
jgi:hypothetical protein